MTEHLKRYEIIFKKGYLEALKQHGDYSRGFLDNLTIDNDYLQIAWNAFCSDCETIEDMFDE